MAVRVLIKVLTAATDSGANQPFTQAHVTFIPSSLIREDPADPLLSSGLEPYWKEDWQAETYSHNANGHYLPDTNKITSANLNNADNPALDPAPGDWLLVVWGNDLTPVIQRITLQEKSGVLRALPGWKSEDAHLVGNNRVCAETVSITNYSGSSGATVAGENTLITVTLFPAKNFFFFAGYEYPRQGTRFIIFAENRMKELYNLGVVDNGSRIALFDCEGGTRNLVVKAKSGWVTVSKKEPMAITEPAKGADDERMGILEYYKYLDYLGFEAAGTLRESGIFSHAYFMGPILWNTYDKSGSQTERDPHDLDGRSKDWQSPGTMDHYKYLKDAFHADGFFKLWGCHAEPYYVTKLQTANNLASQGKPRDEFAIARRDTSSENVNLNFMKYALFMRCTRNPVMFREYCSAASAFTGKPCWGAPLGNEANYLNNEMKIINTDAFYTFVSREFALDLSKCRDKTLHFDYSQLIGLTAATPPWNTQRWASYTTKSNRVVEGSHEHPAFALPGAFVVMKETQPTLANMAVTVQQADGMHTAGVKGHLYIFNKMQPVVLRTYNGNPLLILQAHGSIGTAVLCDETFHSYLYTRSSQSAAWELYTTAFSSVVQIRDSNGNWSDDPSQPVTTITDGLVWTDTGDVW